MKPSSKSKAKNRKSKNPIKKKDSEIIILSNKEKEIESSPIPSNPSNMIPMNNDKEMKMKLLPESSISQFKTRLFSKEIIEYDFNHFEILSTFLPNVMTGKITEYECEYSAKSAYDKAKKELCGKDLSLSTCEPLSLITFHNDDELEKVLLNDDFIKDLSKLTSHFQLQLKKSIF